MNVEKESEKTRQSGESTPDRTGSQSPAEERVGETKEFDAAGPGNVEKESEERQHGGGSTPDRTGGQSPAGERVGETKESDAPGTGPAATDFSVCPTRFPAGDWPPVLSGVLPPPYCLSSLSFSTFTAFFIFFALLHSSIQSSSRNSTS